MSKKLKQAIKYQITDYKLLLRSVPSVVVALFVMSVVIMNILASKEIKTGVDWLALDCGFVVSWMSFLTTDMITKRFGPKAAVKLSIVAAGINLLAAGIFFGVSKIPGNWSAYYTYESDAVNLGLNETFGGTWYILLGSTIAFLVSAAVNSFLNYGLGKLLKKDTFGSYAIRTYISTGVGQFVDNFVFALIVSHTFFGWSMLQCVTCSFTGCILETLCEIVFSPLGYRVCKNWQKDDVGSDYLNRQNKESHNV